MKCYWNSERAKGKQNGLDITLETEAAHLRPTGVVAFDNRSKDGWALVKLTSQQKIIADMITETQALGLDK